ncbi:bifunctional metallophosphatase/5'-nucleotidase [Oceanisphaera pacifica]|uniref:Bifunctional metallophosphatase/5'-nucleotidase n=1 Tax=Oceanisphaera pacifica TaxID=2818389 RepID=A0ABS3NIR0_9GAMM|nr:bifunctional metallophosphatase/5'-nucleotidase [Oceanisphaera pacifica]MBO1520217.1 bifunctional metallophosphatase/5'-nucleotidase [Oceanisphaera pacifica]
MNKPLIAGLLTLALAGCASSQPDQPFSLTVAHINDTHSHFDPSDVQLTLNNKTVYTRVGGHPRLLSYANQLHQQAAQTEQPFLLLHAGDAWQGSGYFKLNEGAMNVDLLNQLPLDAMVLGNHEFDLNNQRLSDFIDGVTFPIVAANLDVSQDSDLQAVENLTPYVLYAFKGDKKKRVNSVEDAGKYPVVAIMGLVLEDMANIAPNIGQAQFKQELVSAQQTVDTLTEQGVKHIIALTHLGLDKDQQLAEQVNGIDVIVGGHSHSLLGDFSQLGWEKNAPYAQQFTNPDGLGISCVVQAGKFAQAMGELTVNFTLDGQVTDCKGTNTLLVDKVFYNDVRRADKHRLTDTEQERITGFLAKQPNVALVDEDPGLRTYIDETYRPELLQTYGAVIGHVPSSLQHVRVPVANQGSQVAPLVAASQLYWANTPEVRGVSGREVDFALVAAGAVRNNIEAGELKAGHVGLDILPFVNAVSLVSLTGREVAGLLLETINGAIGDDTHAGQFPYVSGLRYTFNETRRGHGYLANIEYLHQGEWQRIIPDARYQVVLTGYHASGNDGWHTLFEAQQAETDRIDLAYVQDELTAFLVSRLSKNEQGAIEVHYQKQALDCQLPGVSCNADAQAFIDYVQARRPILTALPESGVTVNRLH